jgi:hypothetical protein
MPDKEAVIWLNAKEEFIQKLVNMNYNKEAMLQWEKVVIGNYKEASQKIRQIL